MLATTKQRWVARLELASASKFHLLRFMTNCFSLPVKQPKLPSLLVPEGRKQQAYVHSCTINGSLANSSVNGRNDDLLHNCHSR